MAGRQRRRSLALVGERIEDLTIAHYERAWELIQGKAPRAQVLRLVPLTGSQLHHMWTTGLAGRKGRYPDQPSFELRIAEQLAALRAAGAAAATEVAIKGVRVLAQTFENAEIANEIANMLLVYERDALREAIAVEMAKPPGERSRALIEEAMLGEEARLVLRTMQRWADARGPTMAFGKMFGLDLTKLAEKEMLPLGVIDAEAREKLPASQTLREEMGGAAGTGVVNAEIAKQFDGWTEEELEAYLADMGEPARKS
jgi:hypothetical protein